MKLTQNQFFGKEFEKPDKLPEGSSFFDVTNKVLYFYNRKLAPIELKLNWGQLSGDLNDQQDLIDFINSNGGGSNGKSAYEIAVDNGFVGTEQQWLDSLVGPDGNDGNDGANGVDGDSAYEIAVNNGFSGTEQEWLQSLEGEDGEDGEDASSTLSLTSSQSNINFDLTASHIGGLNKFSGISNANVTIQPNSIENIPVNSVAIFRQYELGTLTAVAGSGVTLTSKQTYKEGDTLTLWQESLDNWVVINPPESIHSRLDGEPAGAYLLGNIVGISQADYDAGSPVATTTYIIE